VPNGGAVIAISQSVLVASDYISIASCYFQIRMKLEKAGYGFSEFVSSEGEVIYALSVITNPDHLLLYRSALLSSRLFGRRNDYQQGDHACCQNQRNQNSDFPRFHFSSPCLIFGFLDWEIARFNLSIINMICQDLPEGGTLLL